MNPWWREAAACTGSDAVDPEWWFAAGEDNNFMLNELRDVCARCPVKAECLSEALRNDEYGVWGGLTRSERQTIRRAG